LRGIERCDSVTIDPHKWLAVPFVAGVMLTRHPQYMQTAFGVTTPYMPRTFAGLPPDNFKVSAQWTRRMNSMKLWLTLQMHGRLGYQEYIDNQMKLASKFAEWADKSDRFELAIPQVLPILNLRLKNLGDGDTLAQAHMELVDRVTQDGTRWICETRVEGESVIRIMIVSYLTTASHLEALQRAMDEAATELAAIKRPLFRGAQVGSGERGR
jgi:glutamate/tyrosine decarboxylase-like PLP-dependent enzyme